MLNQNIANALNRLLAALYRSLPMYLTEASPWIQRGDQPAVETLRSIVADQKSTCSRIAHFLQSHQTSIDTGEYPMSFTSTHDLSIEFLVTRLITHQKQLLTTIERVVQDSARDPQAHGLAEEALGAARAHLEMLTELNDKLSLNENVSKPSQTAVG